MPRQLLPDEFIEDSLEAYLGRHRSRRYVIYLAVVAMVLGGIAALPLITVEVSVPGHGIVRPVVDIHEILAPTSAPVAEVLVRENQLVHAGDTVLALRSSILDAQLQALNVRIEELLVRATDLAVLLARPPGGPVPAHQVTAPAIRQDYEQYVRETAELDLAMRRATGRLSRVRNLHADAFVTAEEVEGADFQVRELSARRASLEGRYWTRWETERARYQDELRELRGRREQLLEELNLYWIRAPITGMVGQLLSLSPGSFVVAGQRLMLISPEGDLVADLQVESHHIARVRAGMPVRLQVDAFNYSDWGALEGRVLDVSDDVTVGGNAPTYRVRASLGSGRLELPDGRVGVIQKGMALHARFAAGRYSLFQLIRADVRRRLDPFEAEPPPRSAARES